MLKIEVVRFYPFEIPHRRAGLVGYADVKLGEEILIKAVRLMRNRHGGYYILMPAVQIGERSREVVEILSKELLEEIRKNVLRVYREENLKT